MTSCDCVPRRPIPFAFALAALAACHAATPPPDGDVLATLTPPPLSARPFDPDALRGAPSLVMFVSPTCTHCLKELPRAQAIAKAEGIGIVAVFVDGNRQMDRAFVQQAKFAGPALVDDGSLFVKYAVTHVPYALVLGGDGHARAAFIGEREDDELRAAIADAR